ncbi:hypothetical protein [Mesobacillus foraminis]|uniref:Uncharacterized protein n=1 Tax=Mesobacillus foraminis TaxID=279826 RepID=A0A4R2BLC7_9BACI|nr:hypothetical protein [Mesobacillus foraminis]TCN27485.1 hypothetical protein EV146_102439 [Mesobacillus foraminis]
MNPFMKFVYYYGKTISITLIVVGILGALAGVSAYVVGAIPGLLMAWLGWKGYKLTSRQEELSLKNGDAAEKKNRWINGVLAVSVTGIVIAGIIFGVMLVLGIYAIVTYKP